MATSSVFAAVGAGSAEGFGDGGDVGAAAAAGADGGGAAAAIDGVGDGADGFDDPPAVCMGDA